MSVPTIGLNGTVLTAGTVVTKCGLVRFPCPLFTALVLLVFIEILEDRSHDLTLGIVGELCTGSCSRALVDSLDSSNPFEIG